MESGSIYLDFISWLQAVSQRLPLEWPAELPPETESETEGFWMVACREEMRTRHSLSAKIPTLGRGPDFPVLTPLEGWLFRRRMEWALQLVDAASQRSASADVTLEWMIDWALVRSWETDGCQGLWLHAERGGKLHPEVPGWLRDFQ